jgi:hypothetical protein
MGDLWAFPVAAALVGIACLPINRYYNENYGRRRPSTRQQVRGAIAVVLGLAVIGGGRRCCAAKRAGRSICQSTRPRSRWPRSC